MQENLIFALKNGWYGYIEKNFRMQPRNHFLKRLFLMFQLDDRNHFAVFGKIISYFMWNGTHTY